MPDAGMIKALGGLVNIIIRICNYMQKYKLESKVNSVKIDLLEMHEILKDTISSAERSLSCVGNRKKIEEFNNIDSFDIGCELVVQLSRLHRIDDIIRENNLINIDTKLKNEFNKLIKWKEGVLFSYGAQIQFFPWIGFSRSKSQSREQQLFDLYRFCFLNSDPEENINKKELEDNVFQLKESLSNLECTIKYFFTPSEIVILTKEARERANKYSNENPMSLRKT